MVRQHSSLAFLVIITALLADAATSAATANSDDKTSAKQPTTTTKKPNIVFLVCESTDGRTWREGYQDNVIPLPNLRYLEQQAGGYAFHRHYSNTPVCCPSRATFWSGRHAHKIPHVQRQSHTNERTGKKIIEELAVDGVWNNFEGLPRDFDQRIDQVLQNKAGYATYLSGKQDFTTGGHTDNVKLSAWTMYTRFPYDLHETKGWADELPNICADNGTVLPGNQSAHGDDWKTLNQTVDWIRKYHQTKSTNNHSDTNSAQDDNDKPFFVYQGMNIVHPPYATNDYYYNQIDPAKIEVPKWPPLEDLHPCDLQSSMLKGCIPPLDNVTATEWYYSRDRRRNIRRIYYSMIAEFDAMVGAYMDAIRDIGEWENTVFIVTSDHGDMQMEHQQSYKMTPYDASASVPLIIHDGRRRKSNMESLDRTTRVIDKVPTQLIDLYPTMMELAGVSRLDYPQEMLDGHSLVPVMRVSDETSAAFTADMESERNVSRPDFVVSQFHGMNVAMSWFLIVRHMPCVAEDSKHETKSSRTRPSSDRAANMCTMKLVIYGTGNEADNQLFDLTNDPNEMINLASNASYDPVISSLEQTLRSVVDYPRVALNVASYNLESMKHWIEVTGEPQWRTAIHSKLRWDDAFNHDIEGSFKALEEWLQGRARIFPCRSDLVWPPPGVEPPSSTAATS